MTKLKIYIDKRRPLADGKCPVKLSITHAGKTQYISLGVSIDPELWDGRRVAGDAPTSAFLALRFTAAQAEVLRLSASGEDASMTMAQMKQHICVLWGVEPSRNMKPDAGAFLTHFQNFVSSKSGRTAELYQATLKRLLDFCPGLDRVKFEDITPEWLRRFKAYLDARGNSANSADIHFRNIRAVFNDAITAELTQSYPFRRFRHHSEATPKRSLTLEQLRALISTPVEPFLRKYVDAFLLMFALRGINVVDFCHLKELNGDTVEYTRSKTKKPYIIKVQPEGQRLIERLRGQNWLLYPLDRVADYRRYTQELNEALRKVSAMLPGRPHITSYTARHTWSTIASDLDIPKEVIAAALGHGAHSVTDIYIRFDQKKADRANRLVLDWVLYGKRRTWAEVEAENALRETAPWTPPAWLTAQSQTPDD